MVTLFAVFLVLHGVVYALYAGQSLRFFELAPGLEWPDGSWLFSTWLGSDPTRAAAAAVSVLTALAFVVAGMGLLARQSWWFPVTLVAIGVGTLQYVLLWDGKLARLDQQGVFALLINGAILVLIALRNWPSIES